MFGKRPNPKTSLTDRARDLGGAPGSASKKQRVRADRLGTFKNGGVTLENGERMAVVVKDVSDTGARIEFFVRAKLPNEFVLSEPTLRIKRKVRVIWQVDGSAGVQFID